MCVIKATLISAILKTNMVTPIFFAFSNRKWIKKCLYQIWAKSYRFWKFIETAANLLNRRSCATCRRCTRWRNAGVLHGHSLCRRRRLWRCLRGACLSSTFVTFACQSFHSLSTSPVVSAECRPDCCKSCENEWELILERARLDLQMSFLWGLEEDFGRDDSISSWSGWVKYFRSGTRLKRVSGKVAFCHHHFFLFF